MFPMRQMEMSAKTVDEAVSAACAALGVDRDDLNVSYEVLEFPEKKFFRSIPAKVRVTVEEPEAPAAEAQSPAPEETKPSKADKPEPVQPQQSAAPAAEPPAPAASAAEETVDLTADARLQAAVDYLKPILEMMGAENVTFRGVRRGETTVLCVEGEQLGALIGRRGETMESLSYLTSLVANQGEGSYIKLGIDIGGYRAKREADLTALAQRIAVRVQRSGYSYELEPMNPYERHIIHSAVSAIEGVRSESKGEGIDRRVVIYSTDPNASNLPDRGGYRPGRGGHGRNDRRDRSPRGDRRNDRGPRSPRGRDDRRDRGARGDRRSDRGPRGPRPSGVPEREFAGRPWDPDSAPTVPGRSERIHDGDEFAFGKIEL